MSMQPETEDKGPTPEELERLQLPNGFSVDDEGVMKIEILFDGEIVTFRDAEGDIVEMGALCYLDYIVRIAIEDMVDPETPEETNHPAGITPGHVAVHVLQSLHEQWHNVQMQKKLAILGQLGAGDNPLAALGALGIVPLGAFVMGEDGEVTELTPDMMGEMMEGGGGLVVEGESEVIPEEGPGEAKAPEDDDDGLFIQGVRVEDDTKN